MLIRLAQDFRPYRVVFDDFPKTFNYFPQISSDARLLEPVGDVTDCSDTVFRLRNNQLRAGCRLEKDCLLCPVAGVYLSLPEALQALNDRLRGTENMQLVVETE